MLLIQYSCYAIAMNAEDDWSQNYSNPSDLFGYILFFFLQLFDFAVHMPYIF